MVVSPTGANGTNIVLRILNHDSLAFKGTAILLLSLAWRGRNLTIFSLEELKVFWSSLPSLVVAGISSHVLMSLDSIRNVQRALMKPTLVWSPPSQGVIKSNCDFGIDLDVAPFLLESSVITVMRSVVARRDPLKLGVYAPSMGNLWQLS